MIPDVLIPFVTTGLAELGDKTQLSILLLSSKTKKHLELLLGVMAARRLPRASRPALDATGQRHLQ